MNPVADVLALASTDVDLSFVFFSPNFFGEPDNFIMANPLQTPPEIVPEWYSLPFYAILRSITFNIWFIPAKLIGIATMFSSILVLMVLPWLDRSKVRSAHLRPLCKPFFWLLIVDCFVLGMWGRIRPRDISWGWDSSPRSIISCSSSSSCRSWERSSGRGRCPKASALRSLDGCP